MYIYISFFYLNGLTTIRFVHLKAIHESRGFIE